MLTEELYFDYVIRFRGNIAVTAAGGGTRSAAAWVQAGGRARVLRGTTVTADRYPVGTVVCVQDPDMEQAWCLAASAVSKSSTAVTRAGIVNLTSCSQILGRSMEHDAFMLPSGRMSSWFQAL